MLELNWQAFKLISNEFITFCNSHCTHVGVSEAFGYTFIMYDCTVYVNKTYVSVVYPENEYSFNVVLKKG